ncbi:MAG: Gfo/Idh/MocA family oxidoreductase [Candidatus Omnitrophica bacterium]|nr:Gfo/Idh/MocA family oxidoreductase [Candidatus Omnitrophota bacterium]
MSTLSAKRRVLGVAVAGLGVGAQHARAYAATGRCDVRYLYDVDSAKSRELSERLGTGRAAERFEQLLEDPEVDVVSIASYDDAHVGQVIAALRAGKSVFVEKPLCRSMAELETIQRTWEAHGCRPLASNLVLRAAPLYQRLRARIEAGELGSLYAFDGEYLYGRLSKITDGWRKDVPDYSVMQGGGVHLVDLMLWLTGQRPVAVTARGNRICTAGSAFRYHDYVAAAYEFPSGLIGRITANFGCVHPHQHVVRVFGTAATFLYDDAGARLHTNRDSSVPSTRLAEAALPESKGDLIPAFVRAVAQGEDLRVQTQQEFDVMRVTLAADEALAAGQRVTIS